MNRHRAPEPPNPDRELARAKVGRLLKEQQIAMLWINTVAGCAMILNLPGTSPAMAFLAATGIPLPAWGAAWLAVAAILLAGVAGYRVQEYAHALAVILWACAAAGTVSGLFTFATTSPSASVLLTGLITGMAGWHTVALLFRRRLARYRKNHP